MHPGPRSAVLVALLAAGACLPHARGHHATADLRKDVIPREEIEQSGEMNAYDLVARLRPFWLTKRGQNSILPDMEVDVAVYLDGLARLGGRTALRDLPTSMISEVRFLDAAAANYRFGQGHPHGAIVVSTVFPIDTTDADSATTDSTRADTTHRRVP